MANEYSDSIVTAERGVSWSSIFAGTFVFLAIEVTFGLLGLGVFASSATPQSANPVSTGISWGAGIWAVILTIIALYYGGKTAAKLSSTNDRNRGMYYGLVTFGMAIFTTILVTTLTLGSTVSGTPASNPNRYSAMTVTNTLAVGGYWVFVVLILAMIAAAVGGMHGVSGGHSRVSNIDRKGLRPAA